MEDLEGSKAEEEDFVNPCPPTWLDNQENAILRGDAIGDTAYSHRWVLNCLFNITQALPKYLKGLKVEKPNDDESEGEGEEEEEERSDECNIMELDTLVEDSACQLWDMTVEKAVTLHILNLEEVDILALTSLVIEQSCAPRLTEVMVGVLANICCQKEGCIKILEDKEHKDFLVIVVSLTWRTSDVPTLIEVFRLLRLLMWHRINRTDKSTLAACPMIKLLCQESSNNAIVFILKNSLSNSLLCGVLELLSSLLFLCLPETEVHVAAIIGQESFTNALLDLFITKSSKYDQICDEELQILHKTVVCVYAFIDTPGAALIQKRASTTSQIEASLTAYVEHEGKAEVPEDLSEETSERLCSALGLCQLLIPQMKLPSLITIVGRLLGVLHGQTHQYTVSRTNSMEENLKESGSVSAIDGGRKRRSSDKMDLQFTVHKNLHRKKSCDSNGAAVVSSSPFGIDCGWLSPSKISVDDSNADSPIPANASPTPAGNMEEPSPELSESLCSLLDTLEEYCFQLIGWWWRSTPPTERAKDRAKRISSQIVILDALDECHAHEVVFILDAVRKKDQLLVPKLQEQLLDRGTHLRLVAILAHMYQ